MLQTPLTKYSNVDEASTLQRVVETLLVDDGVLLQRIFSNVVLLSDHMTDFDLGRRSFIQFVSRKNERTARVVRKKETERRESWECSKLS